MMTQPDTSGRPSGIQWNTGEIHIYCVVISMPGKKFCANKAECHFLSKKSVIHGA